MKKLFRLLVVLALLGGGAYVWYLQSVHYVLWELKDGLERQDVAVVEKHCDLDRVAGGFIDFGQATAEVAAEDAAGSLGKGLLQGLADLVRGATEQSARRSIKADIQKALSAGQTDAVTGPFKPYEGFTALGGLDSPKDGVKTVRVAGECEGGPAEMPVDFERADGGPFGLPTWRCVGMSKEGARKLARMCADNARLAAATGS